MPLTAANERVVGIFRRGAWYESHDTCPLEGTALRLSLAPEIMIRDDVRWASRVSARGPLGRDARALLRRALDVFEHGTVVLAGGREQTAPGFRAELLAAAGIVEPLVRRWCGMLGAYLEALPARGVGATRPVLVSLPSNTFTCLESVLDLLVAGEPVWIRPSRREPLAAERLIGALLAVGWPPEHLGFYPTTRGVLRTLVESTERQVVYGGDGLTASLETSPGLELRGAGRACALVDGGAEAERAAEWLEPLVAADAGRFCKNVRSILCDGDSLAVAGALARRLDAIRLHPPGDDRPLTPCRPAALADQVAAFVHDRVREGDRIVTRRALATRVDGEVFMAPTLVHLADPEGHELVGCELLFPFAVIFDAGARLRQEVTARSRFVYRGPDTATLAEAAS